MQCMCTTKEEFCSFAATNTEKNCTLQEDQVFEQIEAIKIEINKTLVQFLLLKLSVMNYFQCYSSGKKKQSEI